MKTDKEWIKDFAMGIHSNIPICCVTYFCNVWTPLYTAADKRRISDERNWALVDNSESLKYGNRAQYVQCPECFDTDRVVNIHRCKPDPQGCFLDEFIRVLYPRPKRAKKSNSKKKEA